MQIARGKKLIKSQRRIEDTSSFSILHNIWSLKTIKENYFLNHIDYFLLLDHMEHCSTGFMAEPLGQLKALAKSGCKAMAPETRGSPGK